MNPYREYKPLIQLLAFCLHFLVIFTINFLLIMDNAALTLSLQIAATLSFIELSTIVLVAKIFRHTNANNTESDDEDYFEKHNIDRDEDANPNDYHK